MAINLDLYGQCLVTCKGPARSLAGHIVRVAEKTAAFDGVTLPVLYAGYESAAPDLSDLTADLARRMAASGRIPHREAQMRWRLSFQEETGLRQLDRALRRAAAEQFANRWQGILVLEVSNPETPPEDSPKTVLFEPAGPEYIRAVAEYILDQPQILWIITAPLDEHTPLLFYLKQLTHLVPIQLDNGGRVQAMKRLTDLLDRQAVGLTGDARALLEETLDDLKRSETLCQRLARELCLCAQLLDDVVLDRPHVERCLRSVLEE
ncbi:MAG: hypothetical protein IJ484_09035 [Oscillospiraceae bacterium]|nr:hypothetical protein [Oscillospiraceae bacterium]